jgi:hypothetical protein
MLDIYVNEVFVIIPKLLCINLLYFLVRISKSMLGFENIPSACPASMDSVVDLVGQDFSQQIKRNFQYFATTANSAMDYLTKFIKDGIVDNPLSQEANPMAITSPSPLRIRSRTAAHILSSNVDSRSFHKFYNIPSSPFHVQW